MPSSVRYHSHQLSRFLFQGLSHERLLPKSQGKVRPNENVIASLITTGVIVATGKIYLPVSGRCKTVNAIFAKAR